MILLGLLFCSIGLSLIWFAFRVRNPKRRVCRDGSCQYCRPWARFFGGRDE